MLHASSSRNPQPSGPFISFARIVCFAIVAIGLMASTALAAWTQQQKITSTPRGVGAQHGNAVAINGNTMVVGARFDSTTSSQAGAAFVYVLNAGVWTQQAVLLANDGAATDKFGYSVAISEDTIVVGAYQDDSPLADGGSAYVFVRNGTTWTQQQKLTASDGAANDEFGNSVAIEAEFIVVGSHLANLPSGGADTGSAYIFQRSGTVWTNTQKLIPVAGPNGPILGDLFGESVAVSGSRIAVGAAGDDTPETRAGAVYVFVEGGGVYVLQQKITIGSGTNGDNFGGSVAMEGNTLVGGAREDAPFSGQTARGSAYVFEFNGATWVSEGQLLAADGAAFDRFGYSVAVSDGVVAVGAREDDTTAGPDAGSAYLFTWSGATWTQQQKLAPSDPFNGDRFGASVALSFGYLVVGASEKALSVPNGQGAAYSYQPYVIPACASPNFGTALSFGVGSSPESGVVGDFNGDGKPDIAATNWSPRTVSVALGDGGGGFGGAGIFSLVGNPTFVNVGDFNHDAKLDLAVTSSSFTSVSIFLGNGLGGFGLPVEFYVGSSPGRAAVADFNLDGKPDLATANAGSDNVSVLLGDGTGGFAAAANFSVGDTPFTVAVGDFNRDGKPDLATANGDSNNVSVLLGNGTGSFGAASNFSLGFGASDVAVGDFNLDGKADLAVTTSAGVSVLLGNGAGGFGVATTFSAGPGSVAVGYFDLDDKPDLAVSSYASNHISVLLGNGAGGFRTADNFSVTRPGSVAVGDFNLDGRSDLVTPNYEAGDVSVLLNTCVQSTPGNGSITGTVTYGNAIGNPAPPRYVKNVSLSSTTGSPSVGPVITGTPGTYTLTGFGAGSYTITPTKPGGANGAITSNDAARVAQGVSGAMPFVSQNQRFASDASGNGVVSSTDAALIGRFAAGLTGFGNTGQWKFFVTGAPSPLPTAPQTYNDSRSYASVTSNLTGEDYVALLVGEASGNWNPATHPRPAGKVAGKVDNGQWIVDSEDSSFATKPITVSAQHLISTAGKEIVIPVSVEGVTGKEIISYEFNLRYDPSVIQPLENAVDVTGTVSRGLFVVANPYEPGLLRVVVYGAMPIDENGVLLNLRFTAVGAVGSISPLTFERIMFNEGEPRVAVIDGQVELF